MHMCFYYVRNHNEAIIKAWVIFFGWGTREQGREVLQRQRKLKANNGDRILEAIK